MTSTICLVCNHPRVSVIEAALRTGQSVRSVGREFGINYGTLTRHAHHAGLIEPMPSRRRHRRPKAWPVERERTVPPTMSVVDEPEPADDEAGASPDGRETSTKDTLNAGEHDGTGLPADDGDATGEGQPKGSPAPPSVPAAAPLRGFRSLKDAEALAGLLGDLAYDCWRVMRVAEAERRWPLVLSAADTIRKLADPLARMYGAYPNDAPTNAVQVNLGADADRLASVMLTALGDDPAARAKVAAALRGVPADGVLPPAVTLKDAP